MSVSTCQMKERYNQQGFLSAVPVLDDTELREARQAFNHLEREFGEEYTQYSLHNVHLQYPWVMGLTKHPHILQVVQSILGSDVILLDSRFICKYPTTPTPHPTATQAGNDAITSEEEMRSSEKGQQSETRLPFVAWHQDMSLFHHWGARAANSLDWAEREPCFLRGRGASRPEVDERSIHDGFLVHASDPNTSQRRRCGFVIRYIPTYRPRRFHATVMASGSDQFNHFSTLL
uniref:Phytanoyl-CoA 2-hydroxylase n=1 Tax=Salmo trutta TaxID=8032 RepID=A0A674CZK7_SALTR